MQNLPVCACLSLLGFRHATCYVVGMNEIETVKAVLKIAGMIGVLVWVIITHL